MFYIRDYCSINWADHFRYDGESLIRLADNKVVGTKLYRENGIKKGIVVSHKSKAWFAHRIIFIMVNGDISTEDIIDHIDGDPFNNRIENLRVVDSCGNMQNQSLPINNRTGFIGVQKIVCTKTGTLYYRASWMENGVQKYKSFNTNKFGDEALSLAIEFRKNKIDYLNSLGTNYTERHGENNGI